MVEFRSLWAAVGMMVCWLSASAMAGRVASGNELALDFVSAPTPEARREISERAEGSLFFFRYLHVTNCSPPTTDGSTPVDMLAVEPSSDMTIMFTVHKPVSLALVRDQGITNGAAVAVTGRVAGMSAETRIIRLDPVIVRHRDRHSPSVGKELLHEVDPNARKGTDTSTGREIITREAPVYYEKP